jgi:hypothetical protein
MNDARAGRIWLIPAAALALAHGWPAAGGEPAAPQPAAGTVILDTSGSFFRWLTLQRPAVLVAESGAAERTTLDGKTLAAKEAAQLTADLPAKWTDIEFDDSLWPRTAGARMPELAFLGGEGEVNTVEALLKVGVLALRGKFNVTDPAAALQFSLKYRGGVLVYLNGQEVARGGLPPGPVEASAPGEPYPVEAFVDANGKLLPYPSRAKDADRARVASRDRVLGPIELKGLRKGTNILAIELHRSDYHSSAAGFRKGAGLKAPWTPCALVDVSLRAESGGVDSNTRRPVGVQVWNQDSNDRTSAQDYGDPNEPLRPILLTGARNGVFGGKVIVSSDQAIEGIRAVPSEMTAAGGKGAIAAAATEVRYAEPLTPSGWAEPLSSALPARVAPPKNGGAVVPVWVYVRVPADAPAGGYTGSLAISAGGKKVADVPVQFHVADWSLPDPRKFHTFVGIYQSPTTLSMQYNVPEWSDKHWDLMDRSMNLLGQVGNQLVHVTVVDKTKLGNDDGMVTWLRKAGSSAGAGQAAFDYDYSVFEKYLKLVRKHMGAPKFVVLHVYQAGGWTPAGAKQENTVTVLDPATGQREHLQVPEFGTEDSRKFWTPVLLGLQERMAREGMEKSLCLGSLCEPLPSPPEAKMFADILGRDVPWFRQGHPSQGRLESPEIIPGGGQVGLHFFTYLPPMPSPEAGAPTVHLAYWPRAAYFRGVTDPAKPLPVLRCFAAHARFLRLPGFGYVGLDFWNVGIKRVSEDRRPYIWGRWPRASNYPGALSPQYITWPGPDGAEPVTSFQAIREGLQETEAMYVISEALEKSADKLGAELVQRCQQALKDELVYCLDRPISRWGTTYFQINHYGWFGLSQRLFTLAGEVAAKTGI